MLEPSVTKTLEEMCREGAALKGIDLSIPAYAERLAEEIEVIEKKNLQSYFFIVADLMQWAKKNMAIGPGRGSSAGSLVCYTLGITNADPLKYGLLFFRFLSKDRKDAADIDLDVSDADSCFEYLSNKYGHDRVAKLGAVATFQANGSVNEVTKQLSLPRFEFNSLLESIPKYAAGDSRADKALHIALQETEKGKSLLKKYPEFEFAGKVSGNPTHSSTHAAGVLLTNEPMTKYAAIGLKNTAMVDLKDAEKLNLLKLDVLSLDTLLIFQKTLELAGLPRDFLDTVPLDDQAAFDIINDKKLTGLFQISGNAVAGLASKIRVTEFNDIVALSSFGRPGPILSGGSESWVKRRMGKEPISYAHPIFEPYLKDTLGVFCYQEQILLIAHDIGGLDWDSANLLRKAIGKSLGPEAMREYGEPFKGGLLEKGISQEVADKFWNDILGCGSYLFSLSHAVPYGLMSYYSCYLKAHYGLEFAAAALTSAKSLEKQIAFLREAAAEGVGYTPFDIELSTNEWRVATKEGKKILVAPLSEVIGLGPKSMQQILSCRARGEPLPESLQKKLSNPKTTLSSLHPIRDAIVTLPWRKHVNGTVTKLTDVKAGARGEWLSYNVLGLVSHVEDVDENSDRKQEDRKARGEQPIQPGNPRSLTVKIDSDELKGFFTKVSAKSYQEYKDLVLTLQPGKTIVSLNITMVPEISCGIIKSLSVVGEMP